MPQSLKLQIRGLYTHPNTLSEVPEGALSVADNLVIDRESIAETRRGNKQYGTIVAAASKLFNFKDKLLLHDGSTMYQDSDDAGTWTPLTGTFTAPCLPIKVQSADQNGNFYFTSSEGVIRLDSPTGTPTEAGTPRALDINAMTSGVSGFMPDNSQVAYRVVWAFRDSNENLILGAPSSRHVVQNATGNTVDVDITFTIPDGITANYTYQVYRSKPSVSSTAEPDDSMQLVIERAPTGGEIAAGVINLIDSTPEDEKGAIIYTAPTQEGILQSNDRPPKACDITRFRQHMFYANVTCKARGVVKFNDNLGAGQTITIDGFVYTAQVAENIAADEFAVGATVPETLQSLVRVINRSPTNTSTYAQWNGGSQIIIEARTFDTAVIGVTSTNTGVIVTSPAAREDRPNRIFISKLREPEAVPLTNFIDVGSADKAILRILDIRDAVFVLKEDGVYRITGFDTNSFVAEQHDTTIEILAPETAAAFANRVFCFSNQGVVAIGLQGINIVSRPIEQTLRRITTLSNFATQAWATGYDSDRKYIMGLPNDDTDPNVQQLFVYNSITDSWTRWPLEMVAGLVSTRNDRLYMVRGSDDQVVEERKDLDLTDYADDQFPLIIDTITSNTVNVSSGIADVKVGMTLSQGLSNSVVTEIAGTILTLATADLPWIVGAAAINTPIKAVLEWTEETAANPGVLKHWSEITYFFEDAQFREITARFSTNFTSGLKDVTLTAVIEGAWGEFPWGELPWGSELGGTQSIRTYFPKEATRANWANIRLELEEAFTAFRCTGASVVFTLMSTRFR